MRFVRVICILFLSFALSAEVCQRGRAQAALLMENADGISRAINLTGHDAIYFARICAATPAELRRCEPGEPGVVIARYKGIAGYDWLAVPLIPYFYSVEDASAVPARVDHRIVHNLRMQYHEAHLMGLGKDVPEGGRVQRGWNQLVGTAYERRTYAFRFETTAAQDDAFIAWMNAGSNHSHFNIIYRNCADFASAVLNFYFPHAFKRNIFPDGGIVTPRQVSYELARYAQRHPELRLAVLEIPQIPGYRRPSRTNQSASASLILTGGVVPLAVINPFLAGAVIAETIVWGRYPLPLTQAKVLEPEMMTQMASAEILQGGSVHSGDQTQMAAAKLP